MDELKIVGKIRTVLKKFDGEFEEGKEPVEVIEREEPLFLEEAVALGLVKEEDHAND